MRASMDRIHSRKILRTKPGEISITETNGKNPLSWILCVIILLSIQMTSILNQRWRRFIMEEDGLVLATDSQTQHSYLYIEITMPDTRFCFLQQTVKITHWLRQKLCPVLAKHFCKRSFLYSWKLGSKRSWAPAGLKKAVQALCDGARH